MKRLVLWSGYAMLASAVVLLVYLAALPNVREYKKNNPTTTALIELRKEQAEEAGKKLTVSMRWRSFDQISPHLVHSVLLAEDDTFYRHDGLDYEQIKIAFELNWRKKKFVYGASTITQQLARTLYLTPKKSLLRKAKEALIARQLEKELSKKRIMELYLNVAEWGPGIFGAEAAAQHYFRKSASDLGPDEAVALASILPSPRRWSPFSERAYMARKRTRLYRRLEREGFLPQEASTDTVQDEWSEFQPADLDNLQGAAQTTSGPIEITPRQSRSDEP